MNDWAPPTGEPTFVPYTIEQMTKIVDSFALILQAQAKNVLTIVTAIQGLSDRVGDLETLAMVSHGVKPPAPTAESTTEVYGTYL